MITYRWLWLHGYDLTDLRVKETPANARYLYFATASQLRGM